MVHKNTTLHAASYIFVNSIAWKARIPTKELKHASIAHPNFQHSTAAPKVNWIATIPILIGRNLLNEKVIKPQQIELWKHVY